MLSLMVATGPTFPRLLTLIAVLTAIIWPAFTHWPPTDSAAVAGSAQSAFIRGEHVIRVIGVNPRRDP